MTYNFDPDKWYDNELFLMQSKLKNGAISQDSLFCTELYECQSIPLR